jgi:CubicO group peptidase (beta-lactamase class C family)
MKKLLLFILVVAALYFAMPEYIQMGLVHNFANVDDYKLFPQHKIPQSSKPKPWELAPDYNKSSPEKPLLDLMQDRKTCAFLVIQDGKIKLENYWEDYTKETISGSFSMAKTVNALLIGKLLEEGKIASLDDDVKKYVPELKLVPDGKLTIKDVLTMSASFDWHESYWNIFSLTAESYYGDNLELLMANLELRETGTGSLWEYQSCCTQVLGYIIKNASGKSVAAYAREKLWEPLGAEYDAIWSVDNEAGIEKSFCCINATARDFARLGQMVLQQGKWDSVQVIDPAWIAQMTQPATNLKDEAGNKVDWYGYQMWMINYKGHQIPYFRGILGQFIFMIPDKNAVVVRLGKKIKKDPKDPHMQNQDIRDYIEAGLQVLN